MSKSDQRLKTDITNLGLSSSGIPLYSFKYKKDTFAEKIYGNNLYHGCMAQDLLSIDSQHPAVSINPTTGTYQVNYNLIDVDFYQIN